MGDDIVAALRRLDELDREAVAGGRLNDVFGDLPSVGVEDRPGSGLLSDAVILESVAEGFPVVHSRAPVTD